MQSITQTFNDGTLSIYRIDNTAAPGKMPNETLTIKQQGIRYENRTVGMTRFWQAAQADVRMDKFIRCPKLIDVHALDIVQTENGEQFKIEQIQYPRDVYPPCMDLSLSAIKVRYELNPVESSGGEGGDT